MQKDALLYLLIAVAVIVSVVSGCVSPTASPASQPVSSTPAPGNGSGVVRVSDMSAIDEALATGPAFVEFGAEWCGWCTKEEPIVEQLSTEYPGIAFYSVDVDESPGLSGEFYVKGIPQMALVVKKNPDGSYLYVAPSGSTSSDRYKSRILGYQKYDTLKPLMDAALAAR